MVNVEESTYVDEIVSKIKQAKRSARHFHLSRIVYEYRQIIISLFSNYQNEFENFPKITIKIDPEEELDYFEDFKDQEVHTLISDELFFGEGKLYRRKYEEGGYIVVKEIDSNYIQNSTDTLRKNFKVMRKFLRAQAP